MQLNNELGNKLEIRFAWSDNISSEQIDDFRSVVNTVFGDFCTESYFKTKYLDNIYGASAIIVAYWEGIPVGACALWRNDLDGKEAYYAADASVIADYRNKGVYGAMLKVRAEIASQRGNALLYTFPNTNSFPRLKKKGWHVKLVRKVFFYPGISSKKKIAKVEKGFAEWWIKRCEGICHIKCFGKYYLVKTVATKGVGRVLGYVDKETAEQFPRPAGVLWVLYCDSEKKTLYNRFWKAIPVVYSNASDAHIPFWKMDSL